jgi:hypothetical protein
LASYKCKRTRRERTAFARKLFRMRTIARLAPAALLLFALTCRRSPQAPDGIDRPSAAALERLALGPRFQPPADGLLTDAMIDRYARIRAASKGGAAGAETARGFGVSSEELAWVEARIVEALAALDTRRLRNASEETYNRAIASLKRTRDSVRDREILRTLNDQIAALEKERASLKSLEAVPASILANSRRVAPRRAELEAAK